MKVLKVARSRKRPKTVSDKRRERTMTRKYFLQKPEGGEKFEVCSIFFIRTLDISMQMIALAVSKSIETGALQPDMRGTNSKHNRITQETINVF